MRLMIHKKKKHSPISAAACVDFKYQVEILIPVYQRPYNMHLPIHMFQLHLPREPRYFPGFLTPIIYLGTCQGYIITSRT